MISSGNVEDAQLKIQLAATLLHKVDTDLVDVTETQTKLLNILSNITKSIVSTTQDSAAMQLDTLSSLIAMKATLNVPVVAEIVNRVAESVELGDNEVLDAKISTAILATINSNQFILSNLCSTYYKQTQHIAKGSNHYYT